MCIICVRALTRNRRRAKRFRKIVFFLSITGVYTYKTRQYIYVRKHITVRFESIRDFVRTKHRKRFFFFREIKRKRCHSQTRRNNIMV